MFAVLAAQMFVTEARRRRRGPALRRDPWSSIVSFTVIAGFVASFVVSGWLFLLASAILPGVRWLSDPVTGKTAAQWLIIPLVAIGGTALYLCRLKVRFLYGLTEMTAGLFVAWTQVQALAPSATVFDDRRFLLALLTASVYLFVRGADNLHTALNAPKPDISLRLFRRLLRLERNL